MNPIRIALWGPTFAGKTAFLAQVYLRGALGDWDIFQTRESQQFFDEVRQRVHYNHFPDATTPGIVRNVNYMFRNGEGMEASLFVEDRAGRESTELTAESRQRLVEANGLLVLLDPERHFRDLEQQIEGTLGQLHVEGNLGFRKDPRPVAVCLSKADTLIESPEDLERARTHPEEFVREKVSGDVINWVKRYCERFALFPVSSLGVRVRYGVVEPVVFYDEHCRPRIGSGSEPFNLMEPFAWLFRELAGGNAQ